jgi:SAM-dependent methyltransferase
MRLTLLKPEDVAAAYRVLVELYPYIPSMVMWRAWEYAAYRSLGWKLAEPVLDVGCGDGQFFRCVWPDVREVVGIDHDAAVARLGGLSGVYRGIARARADQLPFGEARFASAFANCSLEHMDHLPSVLGDIAAALRPSAPFVLSVVTDKFIEWGALPQLARTIGQAELADRLQVEFEEFHHLVSPLPPEVWCRRLEEAGFEVLDHVPILPELSSRLFLFVDQLWHVRLADHSDEFGPAIQAYLSRSPGFPAALAAALVHTLAAEADYSVGSGAVFRVRRA